MALIRFCAVVCRSPAPVLHPWRGFAIHVGVLHTFDTPDFLCNVFL